MPESSIAIIQFCPGPDRAANLATAERLLAGAAGKAAHIAVLPEMFSCLVAPHQWAGICEGEGGTVERFLSAAAARHRLFIVGGSYVEKSRNGSLYNTSPVFGPDGTLVGRYRKMHLFWTDIPGTTNYDERSILSAGDRRLVFEADGFRVAVGICYDLRFPEFFRMPEGAPVDLYCLPAAFMAATGQAHWRALVVSRAIENLSYFAAAATVGCHYSVPGRPGETVNTFGHSMIVGPWGEVEAELSEEEGVAVAPLDRARISQARSRLAALKHIREDLWPNRP